MSKKPKQTTTQDIQRIRRSSDAGFVKRAEKAVRRTSSQKKSK